MIFVCLIIIYPPNISDKNILQTYLINVCFCTGGGVALLYASNELSKLPTANFDQKIGVQIIQNALKVCFVF